jgi:hypothetical protein
VKKKNGYHEMTYINGQIYKGYFKDDLREGQGLLILKDGSNYAGYFI